MSEDTWDAELQILGPKLLFQPRWQWWWSEAFTSVCVLLLRPQHLCHSTFMRQSRREVSAWFMRLLAGGGGYDWTQKYAILRTHTVHHSSYCAYTYSTGQQPDAVANFQGGGATATTALDKLANRSSSFLGEHASPVHSSLIDWIVIMRLINLILCVL